MRANSTPKLPQSPCGTSVKQHSLCATRERHHRALLTLLLALFAGLLLPSTASAATYYGFKLGNVKVTSDNYNLITGTYITRKYGGVATYDPETKTLFLSDVTIDVGSKDCYAIQNESCDGLTIKAQNVDFLCQKRACGRFDANTTISSDAVDYEVSFKCTNQEGISISNGATLTLDNVYMNVMSDNDNPMNGIKGTESLVLKNGTVLSIMAYSTGKSIKNIATLEMDNSTLAANGMHFALTADFTNVSLSNIGNKHKYYIDYMLGWLKAMPNLKTLSWSGNDLTTIDLSANTKLESISINNNNFTTIDLSANTKLGSISIYNNNINGTNADNFITNLPTVSQYKPLYFHNGTLTEKNMLTESQVNACKAKGWLPRLYGSSTSSCEGAKAAAVVSDDNKVVSIKKVEGALIDNETVFYPWPETSYTKPTWHTADVQSSCTGIAIDNSLNGEATSYIKNVFSGLGSLKTIEGLQYLNTSSETDMSYMFMNCSSLEFVYLNGLNTSNVTTMEGMFDNCTSFKGLDLSGFDTKNVTTMAKMFRYCSSLTSVDVSSFDTQNVTTMDAMFMQCSSLTSLDVGGFDTQNVTNMNAMFEYCSSLASLDISNFTIGSGTEVTFMFIGDTSLKSLNVGTNVFSKGNYTTFQNVGTSSAPCTLYYSKGFDKSVLGEKQSGGYYKWYNGYFTLASEIPVAILSTNSDGTTKTLTFTMGTIDDATATGGADGTYQLNTGTDRPGWFTSFAQDEPVTKVTTVVFKSDFADVRPTSMAYWFANMRQLTTFEGMSYLNTSEVTKMNYTFSNCWLLKSLDLSNFNTEKVTGMSRMFSTCTYLTSLDLSSFNTANVKRMEGMFSLCSRLESVNLSSFDTENVQSMATMFSDCSALTEVDLSNFNTENVTNMYSMFYGCSSLTTLNLASLNTDNVASAKSMLKGCSGLTSLYVGGNDFKNLSDDSKTEMFSGVGTANSGCRLYYDYYFDTSVLGDDVSKIGNGSTVFQWNDGYFYMALVTGVKVLKDGDDLTMNFTYICPGGSYYTTAKNEGEGQYSMGGSKSRNYYPGWYDTDNSKTLIPNVTRAVFTKEFTDNWAGTVTQGWFNGLTKLKTIENLDKLNTSNVTNMGAMFRNCSNLTYIDVSGFNTSAVTNMSYMFYGCSALQDINLSSFNTSEVRNMNYMFYNCSSLTRLDLSGFNFGWADYINHLLDGCTGLTELTVGTNSIINSVSHNTSAFNGVGTESNPCQLNIEDGFDQTVLGEEQSGGYYQWLEGYFSVYKEPTVPVAVLSDNGDGTNTLTFTYAKLSAATAEDGALGTYLLNDEDETPGWTTANSSVSKVVFNDDFASARPTSTYYWFGCESGTSSVSTIEGIANLNTSEVTTMAYMFGSCTSLESVDVSGFDTRNVTNMGSMFYRTGLTALDISNFVINDDTDISYFAVSSNKLEKLNVGSNDFSKNTSVASAQHAFGGVGTADNPCELTFTEGFDYTVLGELQNDSYYKWLYGYFKLSPAAATGINAIGMDADDDAPRYNMAGQRVDKNYKGVVIVRGKKMIVK